MCVLDADANDDVTHGIPEIIYSHVSLESRMFVVLANLIAPEFSLKLYL